MTRAARPGRTAVVLAAAAFLALAAPALAQVPSDQAAIARELFDQGRTLMSSHQYAEACKKFEDSERLDPGGGTLLNLALCHESLGRTATAWAEYHDAVRVARDDRRPDREKFAVEHIAALTPRLSRLRIDVPAERRVAGLSIRRNGVVVDEAEWGMALIVDPGPQVVEARAPDMLPSRMTVTVGPDGAQESMTIAPLGLPWDRRPTAYASFGGAAAAAAAGVVLGIAALDRQNDANAQCPSTASCRASAFDEGRQATTAGNVSTGFFIGAAVLAVVGSYLLLTNENHGQKLGALAPAGPGGATLVARF
jgi:hypothetical protein